MDNDKSSPLEAMKRERARLEEEANAAALQAAEKRAAFEDLERELARIEELKAELEAITAKWTKSNPSSEEPPVVKDTFDGTIKWLIACYCTDERSPYHKLHFKVRRNY